jgi:PAS domain S-box-containing protein
VWYRGALTQLHHGETLVEKTAHVPEQASFGNVASANDEKNHNNNNNDKSSSSSSSGGSDRKETFFQDKHDDSTQHHHVTTMNAPEKTALASISMEEEEMIVNPHSKFQQEMTIFSWDWACSFLPMSFSSSTEQVEMMTAAPETALGSIPLSELVTNHDMNTMEPTAILHHHHHHTNDEYEYVSKMTNPFNTNDTLWVLHQPESALGAICVKEMLVDDDDDDIPTTSTTNNALPRTLQEYYEIASHDERAMVVTRVQSPHAIVDVNDAWVGLCGYTRGQAIDKSLGELLQGEETITLNPDFMKRLQQGKEASTVLVNYDANGRKFINRVHAGPLKNENDVVTHFVGVLQELKQQEEHA